MIHMSEEIANSIYNVLTHFGAREKERQSFIVYFNEKNYPLEWRFCGEFGSGGKFRFNGYDCWKCDMYQEDENPIRIERLKKLNTALNWIWSKMNMSQFGEK